MIQSIQPNSQLNYVIKEYYFIDMQTDDKSSKIPIVDDCCHDIIYYKQAEAQLVYGENETIENIECHLFTILDLTPPYVLKYEDELTFFTIKFQPWMNHYFFGHLKQSGVVNLEDRFQGLKPILKNAHNEHEFENILKNTNQYFLDQSFDLSPKVETVKEICEFISVKKGLVKVKDISLYFNKSRQYINKIFRKEVMCSLKNYITAVKILSLVKQKAQSDDLSLTQLTYDFGYFDQAHFINDFKKVCGVTPSYFFENLPEFIHRHL